MHDNSLWKCLAIRLFHLGTDLDPTMAMGVDGWPAWSIQFLLTWAQRLTQVEQSILSLDFPNRSWDWEVLLLTQLQYFEDTSWAMPAGTVPVHWRELTRENGMIIKLTGQLLWGFLVLHFLVLWANKSILFFVIFFFFSFFFSFFIF